MTAAGHSQMLPFAPEFQSLGHRVIIHCDLWSSCALWGVKAREVLGVSATQVSSCLPCPWS